MPEETPKPDIISTRRFNMTKVLVTILLGTIVLLAVVFSAQWWVNREEGKTDDFIKKNTSTNEATKSASKSATKIDTSDWKTYSNKEFSFNYPKSWYQGKEKLPDSLVVELSNINDFSPCVELARQKSTCITRITFSVWKVVEGSETGPALEETYNTTIQDLKVGVLTVANPQPTNGKLSYKRETDTNVSGYKALKYFSDFEGYEDSYNYEVLLKKDKVFYLISIASPNKGTLLKNVEILNQILSTFKFL